jgi:hypothetical protein
MTTYTYMRPILLDIRRNGTIIFSPELDISGCRDLWEKRGISLREGQMPRFQPWNSAAYYFKDFGKWN